MENALESSGNVLVRAGSVPATANCIVLAPSDYRRVARLLIRRYPARDPLVVLPGCFVLEWRLLIGFGVEEERGTEA